MLIRGADRIVGFTLLETMVALTIMGLLVVMLAVIYSQTERIVSIAGDNSERAQIARTALDYLSRELTAAQFPSGYHTTQRGYLTDLATNPARFSLFVKGDCTSLSTDGSISGNGLFWRAPLMDHASNVPTLAAVGYFVRWVEEAGGVRPVLGRLYLPAASNDTNVSALVASTNWLSAATLAQAAPMTAPSFRGWFAENVLALWVRPLDPLGTPITQVPNLTARGAFTNLANPASTGGDFNSLSGYRVGSTGTNYRSDQNGLPAMLEVALVISDSRAWKGNTNRFTIPASLATNAASDWNSVQIYVDSLPPKIRRSVRVYSTRVAIPQAN